MSFSFIMKCGLRNGYIRYASFSRHFPSHSRLAQTRDKSTSVPDFSKSQLEDPITSNFSHSLVTETLEMMERDDIFKLTEKNLKIDGQKRLTRNERLKRKRSLDKLGVPNIRQFLIDNNVVVPNHRLTEVLQINIGLYCNQACNHCHVESSPKRSEFMSDATIDRCLYLLNNTASIHTVDITGGAPELCKGFRYLVSEIRKLNRSYQIICRSNLTALMEPDQKSTPSFLAENDVEIVASLPCYSSKNVDMQRGKGVFQRSIAALIVLNKLGYGEEGSHLKINLVYNPSGPFLPPDQGHLQVQYKEELGREFGIFFNNLYALANMPIKRYVDYLLRKDKLDSYMAMLVENFNGLTSGHIMCRNSISVDYNGNIFDCDFNQQLALSTNFKDYKAVNINDINDLNEFEGSEINMDNHCYGCLAGNGSS